jgi:hypothetical protein
VLAWLWRRGGKASEGFAAPAPGLGWEPGGGAPRAVGLAGVEGVHGPPRTPWRRSSIFLSLACSTVLLTRGHVDQHLGDGSGLACGAVCTERLDGGVHAFHNEGQLVGKPGHICNGGVGQELVGQFP